MPYFHPTLTAIKQQALTDIVSANLGGSSNTPLPQSIIGKLAYAIAGLGFDLYGFLDYISKQSVPFTATGEYLVAWAGLKDVERIDATSATGSVTFPGDPTVTIPSGSLLSRQDGVQYLTLADGSPASPIACKAVLAGANGNAASGIAVNLSAPMIGVISSGTSTGFVGGADQEQDDPFRSRMLAVYQNPPNGGSSSDFQEWALQVPGCTRAWVVGQGVGIGTVLIYVMFDSAESAFGGFPQGTNGSATLELRSTTATGDQLLVADYIYPLRPVTSLVQVNAPIATPIAFTIQALSPSSSTIQAGITAALADLFVRLGSPLAGNAIYPSDTNAAIESVSGVGVYTLISPVVPITVATGHLPTVGTITWL